MTSTQHVSFAFYENSSHFEIQWQGEIQNHSPRLESFVNQLNTSHKYRTKTGMEKIVKCREIGMVPERNGNVGREHVQVEMKMRQD